MSKLPAIVILLFLFSCKTTSVAVKTPAPPIPQPSVSASSAIMDSVNVHSFRFEWFSGKAKVDVKKGEDLTTFTASLRIKHDSAIWISISPALGLEAARVLLTRDSIRVINRLTGERLTKGYDFFKSFTSLPVNYSTIESMITGNLLFPRNNYESRFSDSVLVLLSRQDQVNDSIVLSKSFQPLVQFLSDSTEGTLSEMTAQYDAQYNPPFSLWRKITIHHPDEILIELTFSKINLNEPLKFPFKGVE